MATTKVVDILDRASIILQDNTNVRFPNDELLKFFNDAQKEVVRGLFLNSGRFDQHATNRHLEECFWPCLPPGVFFQRVGTPGRDGLVFESENTSQPLD